MGGDDVPHSEKVRGTFDELDIKRARGFGLDEWVTLLQRLHIDFSLSTMRDLFDRADNNRDGIVTYSEYQKFAEVYPTLLDSLFYRSKDYWTDVHQLENLEAARKEERVLREREEQSRMNYLESQQETDKQEHRVQIQTNNLKDAQDSEAGARAAADVAHEKTEDMRREVRERAAEHAEARDTERAVQAGLNDARQAVEASASAARSADKEVERAEVKLRELEQMLADHRLNLDRLRTSAERSRTDISRAQSTEQAAVAALLEAQRAVQLTRERLSSSEAELDRLVSREREANDTCGVCASEVARLHAVRDAEQRELAGLKQREEAAKTAGDAAVRGLEEHQRLLAALDAQNQDFNAQRCEVEAEETPLLEQEVLLRQQRESLEDREARLRSSANTLTTSRRSPSPGRPFKRFQLPLPQPQQAMRQLSPKRLSRDQDYHPATPSPSLAAPKHRNSYLHHGSRHFG